MKKLLAILLMLFSTPSFAVDQFLREDGVFAPVTGAAPTGAAGGDLTGTYPNPTFAVLGSATGPLGSATVTPIITIDTKGRVTALSSATITPAINSITGISANCPTWLATATSANLAACMADETGTGSLVFSVSPVLTGTPTAPTAAVDTNTTQLATMAAVLAQAAAATPLGNSSTAVVGTSTRFARADHVHPGREVLSATRTYYVRSDGSDSNTGLVNSFGGAFATWAKAVSTIVNSIDCAGNTVTVTNGNAATFTTTNAISMTQGWVGGCALVFDLGGGSINATGIALTLADFAMPGLVTIQNGTLQGGGGISHGANGTLQLGSSLTFGAASANPHMQATTVGAQIQMVGVSYTVTGGANKHWYAADGGKLVTGLTSVTFSGGGTIAFGTTGTDGFVSAKAGGQVLAGSNTFTCTSGCSSSGGTTTVTGRRYSAQIDGYIDTGGGNLVTQGSAPNYFPGSAVGTGSTMNLSPYGFYNG